MPVAKILLVDDRPANLLVLEAVLADLGEELIQASSGQEALEWLDRYDFAVVLLDVDMPVMSGFETARRIRAHARGHGTPVIFLTAAHDDDFSVDEAYALGAVDYMTKPLLPAVLRAKVAVFVELHRTTVELAAAERERASAALTAKDERLRLILDNTTDYAIILTTKEGEVTEWEGGATAVTGWAPHEAVGQYIAFIFTQEDQTAGVPGHEMQQARAVGRASDQRWHVRKDGSKFFADGVTVALRDASGSMQGYAKIFRDATSERLSVQELERTRERERQAAQELRLLASNLAEANRRQTAFLAMLAHELRNPLAPIVNSLQIMRSAADDPKAVDRAQGVIERQVSHLVLLVDDLLDIARITQGKLTLKPEHLDLQRVVDSALEISMPAIEGKGHQFHRSVPFEPVTVNADPTRLTQVLSNLLNNAAKYTPPGGGIELRLSKELTHAVIAVQDNGIGIPNAALDSVFEMFSQVGSDQTNSQSGLGIGLSLARSLVALHGGTITASSPGEGRGSTFTVRLPLAQEAAAVSPVGIDDVAIAEPKSLRILVVDDNEDAAESLAQLLMLGGHEVVVALDGSQAIEAASAFGPQLVFLDIGLPGMSGHEVASKLRKLNGLQEVVLVALTGWGTEDDRARSAAAGFDHHLTKPARFAQVLEIIASATV